VTKRAKKLERERGEMEEKAKRLEGELKDTIVSY
jgi:hypothetical protein